MNLSITSCVTPSLQSKKNNHPTFQGLLFPYTGVGGHAEGVITDITQERAVIDLCRSINPHLGVGKIPETLKEQLLSLLGKMYGKKLPEGFSPDKFYYTGNFLSN